MNRLPWKKKKKQGNRKRKNTNLKIIRVWRNFAAYPSCSYNTDLSFPLWSSLFIPILSPIVIHFPFYRPTVFLLPPFYYFALHVPPLFPFFYSSSSFRPLQLVFTSSLRPFCFYNPFLNSSLLPSSLFNSLPSFFPPPFSLTPSPPLPYFFPPCLPLIPL